MSPDFEINDYVSRNNEILGKKQNLTKVSVQDNKIF